MRLGAREHSLTDTGVPGETDVLIVGAGPTGLVLALWLDAQGVRVRIIDKAKTPGTASRALAVQARTLELYQQLGLHRDVLERGLRVESANMWLAGEKVGRIAIDHVGDDLSPFPFVIIYPQDEHEKLLIERLAERGIFVEREKELTALEEPTDGTSEHVVARFRGETCRARYIAGCDGARSTVRDIIGAKFPGGTYDHLFYVADVEATGPVVDHGLHIMLDQEGFVGIFPLTRRGHIRIIGTIRDEDESGDQEGSRAYEWSDIDRRSLELVEVDVAKVNWFSTYRVHHRVASPWRSEKGRIFLLGDAAHIHSPVGGQGMNTGIGDAINLAWKLACVLQHRGNPELLDTYEAERVPFAERLVATTDRAFSGVSSKSGIAGALRKHVLPRVFEAISRSKKGRRLLFRTISQTEIEYPDAKRLPWRPRLNNYEPTGLIDWQIHFYGRKVDPQLAAFARERKIAIHSYSEGDAIYLVRPDGYVVTKATTAKEIEAYVVENGIRGRRMTKDSPPTRLTTERTVSKP
jgi:2-polyprenyl-6-methoxyphenol hydroxylase-like FAD-dependent oxidoreductase